MTHHFSYQLEKLNQARRALMLPLVADEAEHFALAFDACWLGLGRDRDVRKELTEQDPKRWIDLMLKTIDTDGMKDPDQKGTYFLKATRMTTEEKREFCDAVDNLANWFARKRSNTS